MNNIKLTPQLSGLTEYWLPLKDYEGLYEVSNLGRVKSLERIVKRNNYNFTKSEKILSPNISRTGYSSVLLSKQGIEKRCYLHRLVAKTFIPNTRNLPEVDHINEDKSNNTLSNLQWITHRDNSSKSSYKTLGSKNGSSKLTIRQVSVIRHLLKKDGISNSEIAKQFKVAPGAISRIKTGKRWGKVKSSNLPMFLICRTWKELQMVYGGKG